MILLLTTILIGISECFQWNTEILQYPPWKVDSCDFPVGNCTDKTPKSCQIMCNELGYCSFNVAVILADNTYYIVNLEEALETLKSAEIEAKSRGILHENITINYQGFDDKCSQEFATAQVIAANADFCAHVIFGPACDYCSASVGRVAKYIGYEGTPVITPVGFSFDFTNPKTNYSDEFYMVINSGSVDFRSYAEFFHLIMDRYGWKKVALMYEKDRQNDVSGEHSCQLLMKSIMQEIKNVPQIDYNDGDLVITKLNYSEYLRREVGIHYAIILLCTSPDKVREIAIEAYNLNMLTNGEYNIFNFEIYNNSSKPAEPWFDSTDSQERNAIAKKAFKSVFTFTPISETKFDAIANESGKRGSIYLDGLYDGMLLYANVINKSLAIDDDSGMLAKNQSFTGCSVTHGMMGVNYVGKNQNENVTMNCNAQRSARYALVNINSNGILNIVAEYNTLDKNISNWNVKWVSNKDPLDTPICGFDMSLCPTNNTVSILIISLVLMLCLGCLIVGGILYRHFKLRSEIYSMAWKVHYDDILFLPKKARSSFQSTASLRHDSQLTELEADGFSVAGDRQLYTIVGYYKAIRVAVKYLQEVKLELNRDQLIELKAMKDLSNDNLVKFYGACIDIPNCILSEYCPKGSLQDILENDNVKLDWSFRISLINDIVRGMNYLHHSAIKSHGALKSSNCLVDNRFVLKIADFGLQFLRKYTQDDVFNKESHSYWERQLWTAPEILRINNPPTNGTQKGDIYSFAIIMHEIINRKGVFYLGETIQSPKETVDAVRKGPDINNIICRPLMGETLCEEEVALIMKKCWAEDAADRPDFSTLKSKLRHMNKSDGNLLDDLLARMEQYASNLETLVEERTSDYLEEKRKCEELLYQLLPKSVAQQLITGESVIAETFDQVTIYFSDIVGFTSMSAESTPLEVVDFLNDLYTCFDSIVENFDVYKVETIGDSYMVVSGLPERNGNSHACEIARMSLNLLNEVKNFKIRHRPNECLKIRIGIHTGPCVAGVVGLKMPRYCLFGDTVNTASRMESNGLPLRIHTSQATKQVLDCFGTFDIERRGEIEMKGKGKMLTYWLNGEFKQLQSSTSVSEHKTRKLPNTPIPKTVRKQMANGNCSALNNNTMISADLQLQKDEEAAVPLLSITSATEYNCNALI